MIIVHVHLIIMMMGSKNNVKNVILKIALAKVTTENLIIIVNALTDTMKIRTILFVKNALPPVKPVIVVKFV